MNMDVVISENLPEKFVPTWMLFVIFCIYSEELKLTIREIEESSSENISP